MKDEALGCMSSDDTVGQAETEDQQRQRLYVSARAELLERQFSNSEAYDKAILTLSSGFLALSLSFIKDILPIGSIAWTCLLYTSWVLLVLAIVTTIITFRVSNIAIDQRLEQIERYYINRDEGAFPKAILSGWVERLNAASGVLFICGVAFTVIFVILNFSEARNMDKSSNGGSTRVDEGHNVPTMQKVVVGTVTRGQPIPQIQQVIKPQVPAATPATIPVVTPNTQSSNTSQSAVKQ